MIADLVEHVPAGRSGRVVDTRPPRPRVLYRYLKSRHVDDFLRGRIRTMPLSYYHDIEDPARRDGCEVGHRYDSLDGAWTTGPDTTQPIRHVPLSIWTWGPADRIYALCFSTELSSRLMAKFEASACVEIRNPTLFIRHLREAVRLEPNLCHVDAGHVTYYETSDRSVEAPEHSSRLAFLKRMTFSDEREFRVSLRPERLAAPNSLVHLNAPHGTRPNRASVPEERFIQLRRKARYLRVVDTAALISK